MSISFPVTESGSTLERLRERRAGVKPASSLARLEANRRNARKSTGPKTVQGKQRASRNAMKHGLCRTLSCLPSECEATFLTFVEELRAELCPATALQRLVFNQIASLTWRIERLPEAQTKLFNEELAKVELKDASNDAAHRADDADADADGTLSPSDVLARRFSDAPQNNGFALMERYERGMRSQLLRLMRHFDQLKKQRTLTPYDPNEEFEMRRAKYEQQLRDDEERYAANRARNARRDAEEAAETKPDWAALRDEHVRRDTLEQAPQGASGTRAGNASTWAAQSDSAGPRGAGTGAEGGAGVDPALEVAAASAVATARPGAGALDRREVEDPLARTSKRTQSKPAENVDSEQGAGKSAIDVRAPVTKRSQCPAVAVTPRTLQPLPCGPPSEPAGGLSGGPPWSDTDR